MCKSQGQAAEHRAIKPARLGGGPGSPLHLKAFNSLMKSVMGISSEMKTLHRKMKQSSLAFKRNL